MQKKQANRTENIFLKNSNLHERTFSDKKLVNQKLPALLHLYSSGSFSVSIIQKSVYHNALHTSRGGSKAIYKAAVKIPVLVK